LSIIDTNSKMLRVMACWGDKRPKDKEFELGQCWAIRRGKVHFVVNPEIDPLCPHLDHYPTYGSLCAPMSAHGEVLGMLHLCIGPKQADLSKEDQKESLETKKMLVVSIVDRYAPSLTNLRLRETLRLQSIHDPLTNLYNRRHLECSLEREARRALRHETSVGIILIDVDHFKLFNDTYSHEAGDLVLRELGAFLKKYTRGEDIACRHGGEEFTLIMPEASLENTHRRAIELWQGVKNKLRVRHHGNIYKITISLGVAVFPDHGPTVRDALNAADAALYRAKAEGRDRVAVASPVEKEV
jgi:diguanylate cyclase (GGDEF)-like protein